MADRTQGNLLHSMRANYQEHGVDEYYRKVNTSYRNPFFPGIVKVMSIVLDRWLEMEQEQYPQSRPTGSVQAGHDHIKQDSAATLKVLDLAAGSGEATLAIESWFNARRSPRSEHLSDNGRRDYQRENEAPTEPSPPNEQHNALSTVHPTAESPAAGARPSIASLPPNPLAALSAFRSNPPAGSSARPAFVPPHLRGSSRRRGSGQVGGRPVVPASNQEGDPAGEGNEAKIARRPNMAGKTSGDVDVAVDVDGPVIPRRAERKTSGGKSFPYTALEIVATDPFTAPAYEQRIGRPCLPLSFQDIADGSLPSSSNSSGHSGKERARHQSGGDVDSTRETSNQLESQDATTEDLDSVHSASRPDSDSEPDPDIYDLVICSFALHLILEPSELFALLSALSRRGRWLIVLAPHKKPEIKDQWGFERWDLRSWTPVSGDSTASLAGSRSASDPDGTPQPLASNFASVYSPDGCEITVDKVRCRVYRSRAV